MMLQALPWYLWFDVKLLLKTSIGERNQLKTGKQTFASILKTIWRKENFTPAFWIGPKNSHSEKSWMNPNSKERTWSSADTRWEAPSLPSSPFWPCRSWRGEAQRKTNRQSGVTLLEPRSLAITISKRWGRKLKKLKCLLFSGIKTLEVTLLLRT